VGRHQTVTLSVPGMTCSACPITVKKAISKVEGVSKVDVTFETREAVVTSMMPRPACRS
jgi:mercuric ion binding protein